ncbi:MAG: sugar transferase [Patescibacteria group bacterium]
MNPKLRIKDNAKRVIDIVGAIAGLSFIAPFLPFIALAIKIDSEGPAFIKLVRISNGRSFYLYKFRTMVKNAHKLKPFLQYLNERNDGPFFKIKNDPRITRTGKWLRKFRIDEFPQLINVLRNEISLVGPRPYAPEEVSAYPENYKHLMQAKAGLTGLSQINGSSQLSFQKTLELDDFYIKNQSLWLDLKIIVKTLLILFSDPTAV